MKICNYDDDFTYAIIKIPVFDDTTKKTTILEVKMPKLPARFTIQMKKIEGLIPMLKEALKAESSGSTDGTYEEKYIKLIVEYENDIFALITDIINFHLKKIDTSLQATTEWTKDNIDEPTIINILYLCYISGVVKNDNFQYSDNIKNLKDDKKKEVS